MNNCFKLFKEVHAKERINRQRLVDLLIKLEPERPAAHYEYDDNEWLIKNIEWIVENLYTKTKTRKQYLKEMSIEIRECDE